MWFLTTDHFLPDGKELEHDNKTDDLLPSLVLFDSQEYKRMRICSSEHLGDNRIDTWRTFEKNKSWDPKITSELKKTTALPQKYLSLPDPEKEWP